MPPVSPAPIRPRSPAPPSGLVLAKASVRGAREFGLSQVDLAIILGVSPATVSRMKDGGFALPGKRGMKAGQGGPTWRLLLRPGRVVAVREFPRAMAEFRAGPHRREIAARA